MPRGFGKDLTHEKTQMFTKRCAEPYAGASDQITRKSMVICTTWRQHRRSPPPTVWQNTTRKQYPDIITAGEEGDTPVLHQQLPPAGRLYSGYF